MRQLLVLFLILATPSTASAQIYPARADAPPLISVTGDAEVKVVPDQVVLTLGVETFDKVLTAAQKRNDEKMSEVIGVVRKEKVKEKDIQTDYIHVEPRYRHRNDKENELLGYYVRKTVVVTLRDITRFEGLLSQVLEAGANHVHGIQFRTSELRKHRDTARVKAIRAAREKAQALALELGHTIGDPYQIHEQQSYWHAPYGSWWRGGMRQSMAQNVVVESSPGQGGGDRAFSPGEISVRANVRASFLLKTG